MRRLELMQARQQPTDRHGHINLHHQIAGDAHAVDEAHALRHAVETVTQIGVKLCPGLGQLHAARGTAEEGRAQALLQPRHLVADGRLRQ